MDKLRIPLPRFADEADGSQQPVPPFLDAWGLLHYAELLQEHTSGFLTGARQTRSGPVENRDTVWTNGRSWINPKRYPFRLATSARYHATTTTISNATARSYLTQLKQSKKRTPWSLIVVGRRTTRSSGRASRCEFRHDGHAAPNSRPTDRPPTSDSGADPISACLKLVAFQGSFSPPAGQGTVARFVAW